ncbi:MAG: hypothetical protein AAGE94_24650 [Acidobacteriota bacterium]
MRSVRLDWKFDHLMPQDSISLRIDPASLAIYSFGADSAPFATVVSGDVSGLVTTADQVRFKVDAPTSVEVTVFVTISGASTPLRVEVGGASGSVEVRYGGGRQERGVIPGAVQLDQFGL